MAEDKNWPKGCGRIIGYVVAVAVAAWITRSVVSCAFYRQANKRLAQIGFHLDPPRKHVASNVTLTGCSAAQQADIKSWMSQGYDRLVAGCSKNLALPGIDAKTLKRIRDRVVDYLTCDPVTIVCDGERCGDPNVYGFFSAADFNAGLRQIYVCVSSHPGSNLTPTLTHELFHLAEYELTGTTSENTAGPFGSACS